MARGAWIRRVGAIGLALAGAACENVAGPTAETVAFEIVPDFQGSASGVAAVIDRLNIIIDTPAAAGAFTIVADTTVAVNPVTGEASADVEVTLVRDPQTFRVRLRALQADGTELYSGSSEVTITRASAGTPTNVEVPVVYTGPPADEVTISPRDIVVAPGASFSLSAVALVGGVVDPNPIVTFSLLNPADSVFMTISAAGAVAVSPTATTVEVIVQAVTPDGKIDHALIQIGDFPPVRRRWVVDPAAAQPWPTQFGTESYPFETIGRGTARAQIRDTVFVAVSTYSESVDVVQPVVLLGDSSIAGLPTVIAPVRNSISSPTGPVDIRRMRFTGPNGGLDVSAAGISMTSTQFESMSGPAVFITQSGITTIDGITISGIGGLNGRGIQTFTAAALVVRNANISNTDNAGIRADSVGVVHIAQSEIQLTGRTDENVFGLELVFVDSALVDSTNIRNTIGGAIGAGGIHTLTARNDSVSGTFVNAVEPDGLTGRASMLIQDVLSARVVDAAFINNTAGGILVADSATSGTATIESSRFEGSYWGIVGDASAGSFSSLSVFNSTFKGQRSQTRPTGGIFISGMQSVVVTGNILDSITGFGMELSDNAIVTVDNNLLRDLDDVAGSPFVFPVISTRNVTTSGRYTNNQIIRTGSTAFFFTGTARDVLLNTNVMDSNIVGIRIDTATVAGVDMITANANQISNQISVGILALEMGGNFQGNNIFGNAFGVANQTQTQIILDATNSWWGDQLGPACGAGATDCNPQSLGNPVSANVTVTPFATSPVEPPPAFGPNAPTRTAAAARSADDWQAVAVRAPLAPKARLRYVIRH